MSTPSPSGSNQQQIQNMNNLLEYLRQNGVQKQESVKNTLLKDPNYAFLNPQNNLNFLYETKKHQIIMQHTLQQTNSTTNIASSSNQFSSPNFNQQQQFMQQHQQINALQQQLHHHQQQQQQQQQIIFQQQPQQSQSPFFGNNISNQIFNSSSPAVSSTLNFGNIIPLPPPPPPLISKNEPNIDLTFAPLNLTFAKSNSNNNGNNEIVKSSTAASQQKSSRWSDSPNPDKQNARPPVKIESETNLTISLTSKILEDLPVGIMVEVLKKQKNIQKKFKPYTTLNADEVPKAISTSSRDQATVQAKIENFYDFMDREKETDRREKVKRDKERELELQMELDEDGNQNDQYLKRDFEREIQNNYQNSQNNLINSEAGINLDGSTIGMGAYSERKGLGKFTQDEFSQFRQNRSMKYHVSAEERSIHKERVELCYKCQRPGHIARDCKFGLT